MKKSELVNFLNDTFIFNNQEDWDNCGPNPKDFINDNITNVFVALDINYETIQKAINNGCNVILSHHPILISDDNSDNVSITNKNINQLLIKNNILNIALHTCFDRYKYNTSFLIYEALKNKLFYEKYTFLDKHHYLLFTNLIQPMSVIKLLKKIKQKKNKFLTNFSFLNIDKNKVIKNICIGAGSCSSMLKMCLINKVDCFLTGDIKWHGYLDGLNNNLIMIDINHTSERVFINYLIKTIKSKFNSLNLISDYDFVEIEKI